MKRQHAFLILSHLALFGIASASSASEPCMRPSSGTVTQKVAPILQALSAVSSSEISPEAKAWKDTGLDLSALRENVNGLDCSLSDTNFSACFWAINEIMNYNAEDKLLVWVPKSYYSKNRSQFKDVSEEIGPFVLSEWAPIDEKDVTKRYKKFVQQKRDLSAALPAVRNASETGPARADFDALLNRSEKLVIAKNPELEALITSDAMNAYLGIRFDPHTHLMLSEKVSASLESYVGIGTRIQRSILIPDKGMPADKAGIQEGDQLFAVDGVETKDLSEAKLTSLVRGQEGSVVRISVLRNGNRLDFDIKREAISPPLTEENVLTIDQNKVGYVHLRSFLDENSCEATKKSISNVLSSNPKGLILDLRDNLGGRIDQSVCIASLFLGPGKKVVRTSSYEAEKTKDPQLTRAPLIVLINSRSASASEILAGSLQEYSRAVVVGERSYGKGTFQDITVSPDFTDLWFAKTGGTYALPSGRSPQINGILPQIEVYGDPSITSEKESPALREEDLFIDVIPKRDGAPDKLNQKKSSQIQSCLAKKGTARAQYKELSKAGKYADYQLMTAAEAMGRCW